MVSFHVRSSIANLPRYFLLYWRLLKRRKPPSSKNKLGENALKAGWLTWRNRSPVQPVDLGDLILVQVELPETRQAKAFHPLQVLIKEQYKSQKTASTAAAGTAMKKCVVSVLASWVRHAPFTRQKRERRNQVREQTLCRDKCM